jgi:predicted N-acyltransferase
VDAAEWNGLVGADDPFLEHTFLAAMEDSGTVGARAGVVPRFVLVRETARGGDAGRLLGALPLYRKIHGYGEFIFDWSWANAAHRSGIAYYPKMVAAIPFTPATGARLLVDPTLEPSRHAAVVADLLTGARAAADAEKASSIHVLFCTEDEAAVLGSGLGAADGFMPRLSLQFHWHNRPGVPYRDFDDYLGAMKSRHRKQIRHERRVAAEHGLTLETRAGAELEPADWAALGAFYSANADRHGSIEYLKPEFFELMRSTYAHRVVATLAYRDGAPVAGTFNFEKGRHLYGRYWGCLGDFEMLHFELCYHRLIERAIARGYTRFEAGAQGEHKLKRGLVPAFTHSAHWIRHPGLAAAVGRFIDEETEAVRQQAAAYAAEAPFRVEGRSAPGADAALDREAEPPSTLEPGSDPDSGPRT